MGYVTYNGTDNPHMEVVTVGPLQQSIVIMPGQTQQMPDAVCQWLVTNEPSVWATASGIPPIPEPGSLVTVTLSQLPSSVASGSSATARQMPVWSSAQAKHVYIDPHWIDPHQEPFNCPADGASDCTSALIAAATAAASLGWPLELRPITYKIKTAGGIALTAANHSGLKIRMQPLTVIDASTLASSSTATYALTAQGSVGSPLALTADATAGSYTITMAAGDAATLAADQWVQIGSSETFPYLGSAQVNRGEIRQIRSVNSTTGVVTLDVGLDDTYHSASSAFARPITFLNGLIIEQNGGKIIGSGTPGDYECGILCRYVNGLKLDSIDVELMDDILVTISSCINFDITRPYVRSLYYNGTNGGLGNEYGLQIIDSSQNGTITSPKGSRCRHLVSVTSTSSGNGVWGCPRDIDVIDGELVDAMGGTAHGGQGDAYQHHGFGQRIRFINCNANGVDALCNLQGGPVTFTGEGRNCYFAGVYINADPRSLTGMKLDVRISQATNDAGSYYSSFTPCLIQANLTNATAPYIVGEMDINVVAEYDATAHPAIQFAQTGAGGQHIQAYSTKVTGNFRNTGSSTGDTYAILGDYWDGLHIGQVKLHDCWRLFQGYGNDLVIDDNDQWASAQGGTGYIVRLDGGSNSRVTNNRGRSTYGIYLAAAVSGCFVARNPLDCTTPVTDNGSGNTKLSNGLALIGTSDVSFATAIPPNPAVTFTLRRDECLPNAYGGNLALSSGLYYAALLKQTDGVAKSNVVLFTSTTTPAGLTSLKVAVWNAAGTVVQASADQSATVTLASTKYTLPLGASVTPAVGQYLGLGWTGTTLGVVGRQLYNSGTFANDNGVTVIRCTSGYAGTVGNIGGAGGSNLLVLAEMQ